MQNISIRRVLASEAKLLSGIASTTFIRTYVAINPENTDLLTAYTRQMFSPEKILEHMADEKVQYYFIEVEAQIAGYTKIILGEAPEFSLELEKLYILESFAYQGLGQKLFNFIKLEAQKSAQKSIRLSVYEHNAGALKFYTKNGFKALGKLDFVFQYNGSEYRDVDWLMILPLTV